MSFWFFISVKEVQLKVMIDFIGLGIALIKNRDRGNLVEELNKARKQVVIKEIKNRAINDF